MVMPVNAPLPPTVAAAVAPVPSTVDGDRDVGQRQRAEGPVRLRPEVVWHFGFVCRAGGYGRRRPRTKHGHGRDRG